MGQSITQTSFSEQDSHAFCKRLDDSLVALEQLLSQPEFGQGERSLGAELELVLIDNTCSATPVCDEVLAQAADKRLTPEINRYNLEANLTPVALGVSAFGKIEAEMVELLTSLNAMLSDKGVRAIPVGILPTLTHDDLEASMITPDERYKVLTRQLRKRRGEKFSIRLKGQEKIAFTTDTVAPEGANTSLQIHYRAHPDRFVDLYNAVQLVTPLVLALGANSPYLLGKQVWHETRIGLFKQSIDGRSRRRRQLKYPARVNFGHGWLRRSALELFAETVHLYTPLLPICSDEEPLEALKEGRKPSLRELALQMGTVWPWNRPVYDGGRQSHVRLELRALPAGPSPIDMMANAALALGLAEGLMDDIESLLCSMPYASLQRNLMVAARYGIGAKLLWPSTSSRRLEERPVIDIAQDLLPVAKSGLTGMGIDTSQQDRYLGCMEERLAASTNGASWQIHTVSQLCAKGMRREGALCEMVDRYAELVAGNQPVAQWPKI